MKIHDESSYKNIWTEKIVNAENDWRNRDTDSKTFRIYRSKFKKYMTLTRLVNKLNKLAMRIFTSQKARFLKYILFDERLLQKQSNQITRFIFSKFIFHFEIIRIKIEIILYIWKNETWARIWARLEREFEWDSNENLNETRTRIQARLERQINRKFEFTL